MHCLKNVHTWIWVIAADSQLRMYEIQLKLVELKCTQDTLSLTLRVSNVPFEKWAESTSTCRKILRIQKKKEDRCFRPLEFLLSRLVQCQRALAMNSTVLVYVRRAWNEHDTVELYCVGNGHKVKSATIEFDDKFKMTSDHMGATIWMSSHNKWKQKEKSEMDIRHLLNQFYKLRMLFRRKANVVLQLALTLLSYKFFVQLFLLFLKRKNAFQLNEKRFFVTAKSWFQFLWVKWDNNFFLLATIFLWWFCCVANIGYVSKKFSIEFSSSATFYSLSFILVNLNNAFHVFS